MRLMLVILFAISAFSITDAQTKRVKAASALESILTDRWVELLKGDFASKMSKYDFGALCLSHQSGRLGYIGDNYQRLDIYFLSVARDSSNPRLYLVRGKSRVKGNVCDFTGSMHLAAVRRLIDLDMPENESRGKNQGVALFTYTFREDPRQKASGVFEGNAAVAWYLDSLDGVKYNDLWMVADGFSNNAFVGTWKSYATRAVRKCNWGDYRIPNSSNLDVGVAEFHPADAYQANGWEGFESDTTAWWLVPSGMGQTKP